MVINRTRVAVAMSGGVDSSLAAALLQEAGYDVFGVSMKLWCEQRHGMDHTQPACCSAVDLGDAGHVCGILGIPHYVLNLEEEFDSCVVDYFCREYVRGRTPNPCIACNQHVKFDLLLARVRAMGAACLATGHFARIKQQDGRYGLYKALDASSDQTYFLYTLGQSELQYLLFPLGEYLKSEVRDMARTRGLPVADKRKSQDLCFTANGGYRDFVKNRVEMVPGNMVDAGNRVLGRHGGVALYTVGQRAGLGCSGGERLYVTGIDAENNTVVVGSSENLYISRFAISSVHYVDQVPIGPLNVKAKVRYRSPETSATLFPGEDRTEIVFDKAQRAVTPGQATVFYDGERLLGGGTIEAA